MANKKKVTQVIVSKVNFARLQVLAKKKEILTKQKMNVSKYIHQDILGKYIKKELQDKRGSRVQKHQKKIYSDVHLKTIHANGSRTNEDMVVKTISLDMVENHHLSRLADEYGVSKTVMLHILISKKCIGVRTPKAK